MKLKKKVKIIGLAALVSCSYVAALIYVSNNYWDYSDDIDVGETYVLKDIASEEVAVVKPVEDKIEKPYLNNNVNISIDYYDYDAKLEDQEDQIIKIDRTYMPNTGILYTSETDFEVVSILDGEVLSVETSDTLGSIIEVKHSNDIVSKYSSLKNVKVKKGDIIKQGQVIASSGENKISPESTNMLLFEFIYKGNNANPNKFYGMELSELE